MNGTLRFSWAPRGGKCNMQLKSSNGIGEVEEKTSWPGARQQVWWSIRAASVPTNAEKAELPEGKDQVLTKPRSVGQDHTLHSNQK